MKTDIMALIVFFMMGFNLCMPVIQKQFEIDSVSVKADPLGDPPSGSPYDYWYAPSNSFGISETKSVNWTYFKQLFLAHTDWMLEARIGTGEWFNADEYLTIERTWNESGFWKFNLILDKPVGSPMVDARFTFGIDLSCLQYVERSGTEVWINYTANATETYSCMFNWSDIASIPGLVITKGIQGDMFWFRFRRDDIPAGLQHYEFDPTFGSQLEGSSWTTIADMAVGTGDDSGVAGTADSISAYIRNWDDGEQVKCLLYDDGLNLIGTTEERTTGGGTDWYIFAFSEPKPTIEASSTYYCMVIAETGITVDCSWQAEAGKTYVMETMDYASPENPIGGWDQSFADYSYSVYCTYSEAGPENNAPTIAGEIPANTSTGISLTPVCNVTANDADGDSLNVTFWENTTGSYVMRQKNTSVSANSSVQWDNYSNAHTGATKYWWKVHVDDGTDNVSEIYHFTTAANSTWQTLDTWNITLSNTTQSYILDTWNLTLSNTTQSYILDTWNITFSNTTQSYILDTWNLTLGNMTITPYVLDTWNITLSNLTISPYILDTWNITLSNTPQPYILDTWNLTLSNTTQSYTLDQWNITLSNLTISPYTLDTWNITLSNTTQSYVLDTWNITLSNLTISPYVLDTWNITISNTTEPIAIVFSNENPSNGSVDQETDLTWNVTIETTNGDTFDWWINCSNGQKSMGYGYPPYNSPSLPSSGDFEEKWVKTITQLGVMSFANGIFQDIDGDGTQEMFLGGKTNFSVGETDPLLMLACINGSTGETIWNVTYDSGYVSSGNNYFWPLVYDFNKDGEYDVIVNSGAGPTVMRYASNGTEIWNESDVATGWHQQAYVDFGNEVFLYLVGSPPSSQFIKKVNGSTGAIVDYAPQPYTCWGGVSIADLDDDGHYELFTTDRDTDTDRGLRCYNMTDLSLKWNKDIACSSHASTIADFDKDGELEVMVVDQGWPYHVYIYDVDGNLEHESSVVLDHHHQSAVGDVDGDGNLELICGDSTAPKIYDLYTHTLETAPSWSIICNSGEIFDIIPDDNNISEILHTGDLVGGETASIWRYNVTTGIYEELHSFGHRAIWSVATDVDFDGYKELIVGWASNWYVSSSKVWCYETNAPVDIPGTLTNIGFGGTRRLNNDEFIEPPGEYEYITYGESNGSKTLSLSGLEYSTEYTLWVNATDGTNWTRESFTFTTKAEPNDSPIIKNPLPSNNTGDQELAFTWNVTIEDPEGVSFDWWINCTNTQTNSGSSDSNGTKELSLTGLSYGTTYTVWVNVTDGVQWTRKWYNFTTVYANVPPTIESPTPANNSISQPLSLNWSVFINDSDVEDFNWWINCSNGQGSNSLESRYIGALGADWDGTQSFEDDIIGIPWNMTDDTRARASNISIRWWSTDEPRKVRCALYDANFSLIAETEERTLPVEGPVWESFNFTYPNPILEPSTKYYIMAFIQKHIGPGSITYDYTSGENSTVYGQFEYGYNSSGGEFPETLSPVQWHNDSTTLHIRCYYNSTLDGEKNISLAGLSESTQYDLWVNATDGTDWTNETYHFTTLEKEWVTLDTWNITLSNTTQPYTLDTWNLTLSNTPQPYILDTWNITLSNTTQPYILDRWNITLSNTSFFLITDVKATPSEAIIDDVTINITCNVTSTCAIVNVTVNMTGGVYDMISGIGDLYYYNAINSSIGTHYYHIYANDTSGDQQESATYSFRIIGLSCSFTYTVNGGLMTLTPTITGATHYQWTFTDETGVAGATSWIPIGDIGSYIQGYVYPTIITVILSAKNINFDQYANFSDVVRIYKSSFDKTKPTVEEPEPEPSNVFKDIADAVGKWFGERNPGEILFMAVIAVIAALFVVRKKYPSKKFIYPIVKKKKKKEKEKTPHEILIERIDHLEENVFPKK